MDWQHEWLTSLTSTAMTWVVTILVGALVVWLLTRYTHWGRQFRRLAFPYLTPGRSRITWRPLLTLLLLLWLTVLAVRLEVLISYATNGLYTALQGLDAKMFWFSPFSWSLR
jgi:putative ATP-binding cassette transporter